MEPAKAAAIAQKSMVCASSCIAAAQFIVSIYEGKMDVVFGEIEQQQMQRLHGKTMFHYPKFGLIAKVDEVHTIVSSDRQRIWHGVSLHCSQSCRLMMLM